MKELTSLKRSSIVLFRGIVLTAMFFWMIGASALAQPAFVQFQKANFQFYENATNATIVLIRTGNTNIEARVTLAVSPQGFGTRPRNFVPTTNQMVFPPGVNTTNLLVALIDDSVPLSGESAGLRLSQPGPNTMLSLSTATLTILEDDSGVAFSGFYSSVGGSGGSYVTYSGLEGDTNFALPLFRFGLLTGELTLNYFARDITATNGLDYQLSPGSVTFSNGQNVASIRIPLPDNLGRTRSRTFRVILTNQPPLVTITAGTAEVKISDSDALGTPGTLSDFASGIQACSTTVYALVKQSDEKIVVGNDCSTTGYLFRLNPDGSRDGTFVNPFPSSVVRLWLGPGDSLYAAGSWSSGVPDRYLNRLLRDGTIDTNWTARFDANVNGLCLLPDGRIVVVGSFTTVNGVNRPRIATLLADGSLDPGFVPTANFTGGFSSTAVLLRDGSILASDLSATEGNLFITGVIRLSLTGAVDWNYRVDGVGSRLVEVRDGGILLAGSTLTRLMPDGGIDPTFHVQGGIQNVFALADGRLLVTRPDGGFSLQVLRLYADGSVDSEFFADVNDSVSTVVQTADGRIVMGGRFSRVNGVARNFLAGLYNNDSLSPARVLWNRSQIGLPERGSEMLSIIRDGTTNIAFDVSYHTETGTATALDFVETSGTVHFAPGEVLRNVAIFLRSDLDPEPDESFTIVLDSPTDGVLPGSNMVLKATIADDDPSFALSSVPFVGHEQQDSIVLQLTRVTGTNYSSSLHWQQTAGNAVAGVDYSPGSGDLFISAGRSLESWQVRLMDDAAAEGTQQAVLQIELLRTNSAPLVIGQIVLNILDNDQPGFGGDAIDAWSMQRFVPASDGEILALGPFTRVHGEAVRTIVRFDYAGRRNTNFNLGMEWQSVNLIASRSDGRFAAYVSGTNSSGLFSKGLYLLESNGVTSPVQPYSPIPMPNVDLGFASDGALFALDYQASYNGTTNLFGTNYYLGPLIRLLPDGSRDTNFWTTIGFIGLGQLAFAQDSSVWLGGSFSAYHDRVAIQGSPANPILRTNLVRIQPDGSIDTNRFPIVDGVLLDMATTASDELYLGGLFTRVADQPRDRLARLHPDGSLDLGFDPQLGSLSPGPGRVQALTATPDGQLVVMFYDFPRLSVLVRFTRAGEIDSSFGIHRIDTGALPVVMQSMPNGTVLIAGNISSVDGQARFHFARFRADGSLGTEGPAEILGLTPQSNNSWRLRFESRLSGTAVLERSQNLRDWELIESLGVTPGTSTRDLTPGAGDTFIRLKIVRP